MSYRDERRALRAQERKVKVTVRGRGQGAGGSVHRGFGLFQKSNGIGSVRFL